MASTPDMYNAGVAPYPPAGQPSMYPNAAEMPPGQPQPVAYAPAPAPAPVAYAPAPAPAPVSYAPAPAPAPASYAAQAGHFDRFRSAPMTAPSLGTSSTMCVCPNCHATVTTTTIYEAGGLCWLICVILICFGLCAGCCLIPFCVNDCKDVVHKCPNCNALIGKYSRL